MSVVVEMSVPPDALGPVRALPSGGETWVEFERIVPDGETGLAPYVWVGSEDFDAFEARLREAASVDRFESIDEWGEERLYYVEWRRPDPEATDIFHCLALVGAAVTSARRAGESWTVSVRFPTEASVSAFAAHCIEHDVRMEPLRISRDGRRDRGEVELTDQQREALAVAVRQGYFEVPRRATLSDLADELAVSDHAVSERLRRGLGRLVVQVVKFDETEGMAGG